MKKISIIIPLYNEQNLISHLYQALMQEIKTLNYDSEIVFIDDGSTDDSLTQLREITRENHAVKVISFTRNFGHQIALSAGIEYAAGDAVIMMDGDLQHPPELIPQLIRHWEEGYEIVYTVRKATNGVSFFKKITSNVFYKFISRIASTDLAACSADFRLLDKSVVENLREFRERTRFVRGLVSWLGCKKYPVAYTAPERFSGNSKYTSSKMLKLALDGITAFSTLPLRLASILGLITSFFGFIYAIYAIAIKIFTNNAVPGWTAEIVTILILGGIQLIVLGIIGEYLGRVYEEVKQRPLYLIKEKIGFMEVTKVS